MKKNFVLVKPAKENKKSFIIVGDNNYWYASFTNEQDTVEKAIKRVKKQITNGEFEEDGAEPQQLYVYEVNEVKRISI